MTSDPDCFRDLSLNVQGSASPISPTPQPPITTEDGSLTLRHPETGEPYHARQGARGEALAKFITPSRLAERLRRGPVVLLDAGFGLGINCLEALRVAEETAAHPLRVECVDREAESLARALSLQPGHPVFTALAEEGRWEGGGHAARFHLADLRDWIRERIEPLDLIYHDPFSPMKNTEAWTVELFAEYHRVLSPDGMLLTYSESTAVRAGLARAGFAVSPTPATSPHRGGTAAARDPALLASPFPPGHFSQPPASVCYHDPDFKDTAQAIRRRREAEVRGL